jgi:hypothetical protein
MISGSAPEFATELSALLDVAGKLSERSIPMSEVVGATDSSNALVPDQVRLGGIDMSEQVDDSSLAHEERAIIAGELAIARARGIGLSARVAMTAIFNIFNRGHSVTENTGSEAFRRAKAGETFTYESYGSPLETHPLLSVEFCRVIGKTGCGREVVIRQNDGLVVETLRITEVIDEIDPGELIKSISTSHRIDPIHDRLLGITEAYISKTGDYTILGDIQELVMASLSEDNQSEARVPGTSRRQNIIEDILERSSDSADTTIFKDIVSMVAELTLGYRKNAEMKRSFPDIDSITLETIKTFAGYLAHFSES